MTKMLKKILPAVLLMQLMTFSADAADQVQIRSDAPTRYTVVEGDTLWDISGRFLEDPWLWPEVWELNPQIENPHLIYPGDVIELQYSESGPLLTLRRGGDGVPDADGLRTVRLSPQIRREVLGGAIPAIPLDRIGALLSDNTIVSRSELESSPYLLDNDAGHLFSNINDRVFGKGSWDNNIFQYDIVRAGRDYVDPDTGNVIGVEGIVIGSASILDRDGDNASLTITSLKEEARKGDRFMPSAGTRIDSNYFPVPPSFDLDASILDISSNRTIGSINDTIVINRGSSQRLKVGDLLGLQKPDIVVEDTVGKATLGERFKRAVGISKDHIETFSGEIYASVLLYKVFDNTSLGIILSADEIVRLEDKVVTP